MADLSKIEIPYTIEVWRSQLPIRILKSNKKLKLLDKKYYLKLKNVYFAEVEVYYKDGIRIIRLITLEESERLSKRCDRYEEIANE